MAGQQQEISDEEPRGLSAGPVVPLERVLDILQHGIIEKQHGVLRWGSNHTLLVTVKEAGGALDCFAVYKPQRGERPLWDFPEGTLCYREVAAYVVSAGLGWHLVPPTVLRQGPYGVGSVQFFIHHNPAINYFSLGEEMAHRLMQFAAFDIVVNNADRKGGHFLLSEDGHLWGIDHGLTFNLAPKLRTVVWDFAGQRIPDDILSGLEALDQQLEPGAGLRCALEELLTRQEVDLTQARVRRLLAHKRYPKPGPGPNYPWPPV